MKTIFTIALASALSFSSLVANASEDLKALSAVITEYKKINVTLFEGIDKAKIAILDADGRTLSQRNVRVKNENLIIPFNLKNLPAGQYQVKIVTDQEEVSYQVETKGGEVTTTDLPLMAYGELIDSNTVSLVVLGLTEPGVDVKVYSKDSDEIIYSDHIHEDKGFKKNYSFTKMNSADVYFKVTDTKGRSKTLHF